MQGWKRLVKHRFSQKDAAWRSTFESEEPQRKWFIKYSLIFNQLTSVSCKSGRNGPTQPPRSSCGNLDVFLSDERSQNHSYISQSFHITTWTHNTSVFWSHDFRCRMYFIQSDNFFLYMWVHHFPPLPSAWRSFHWHLVLTHTTTS